MDRKVFWSLCLTLAVSGCSLLPGRTGSGPEQLRPQMVPRTVVISEERLREGGKVFVNPFVPGEQVAFDEAFDRISLHVVKGVLTVLQQAPGLYTLLGSDQADQAELLVHGRVVEKRRQRVFEKLWKRKTVYILKVEGSIVTRDNDQTIMYFTHELRSDDVDGFGALAEDVGRDVGRSVLMVSQ
ncbi:MAG TPA: hypothetical protein PLT76_06480 [Candidatus Omnitrophota bacterium]|nr:hypothetical protein [Candidatus Omnitrophota bacterium]HQO58352.1 hypothetical protein [Candidatus Omnitrophota bacterium]